MGWIVVVALVLLVMIVIGMYNSLVRLRAACDSAWADIDVQLKRRYDLIPNLVETVKAYEAYPQLRAVEAFNQLQGSLNQIEDAVQNARRYYNAVVRDYNAKTQEIPTNLIAGWFNFVGRQFFELTDTTQREPPTVQF